jgi:hypothetical protein
VDLVRVHKKLAEARFFLNLMLREDRRIMGDKRLDFDFYLSAFLSAAKSIDSLFLYEINLQHPNNRPKHIVWHKQWKQNLSLAEQRLIKVLEKDRDIEVHASGSRRVEATEKLTFGGAHYLQSAMITDGGSPLIEPLEVLEVDKPTYEYRDKLVTIGGIDRKATEACAAYLELRTRMVAKFEADHPLLL